MPTPAEQEPETRDSSFLQARCDKVLVTNDWCLPLVLALLLLLLVYTFLYLPSLAHHNTTLWYLRDEDLERSGGNKHLTSQTKQMRPLPIGLFDWTALFQTLVDCSGSDWRRRFNTNLSVLESKYINVEHLSVICWAIFSLLWQEVNTVTQCTVLISKKNVNVF